MTNRKSGPCPARGYVGPPQTWASRLSCLGRDDAVPSQDPKQLDEAKRLYRQVLEARRRVLGDGHRDTLTSVANLADFVNGRGGERAKTKLSGSTESALEGRRRTPGPDSKEVLQTENNLAFLLTRRDKADEAERLYRRGLEARRRTLGIEHSATLHSVTNLRAFSWLGNGPERPKRFRPAGVERASQSQEGIGWAAVFPGHVRSGRPAP